MNNRRRHRAERWRAADSRRAMESSSSANLLMDGRKLVEGQPMRKVAILDTLPR
jgi:hypothetical protein